MLSIDKTYFYLFCGLLLSLFLSPTLFMVFDEVILALMLFLGMLDMLYNRSWKKYKVFFWGTGILTFYMFYSIFAYNYNIPKAIIKDFVIWMKPVIAFGITYAIAPKFTRAEMKIIRILCAVLCVVGLGLYFTPLFWDFLFHEYYLGSIVLCSAVVLLITADNDEKYVICRNLKKILLLLLAGLVCGRSKYFGSVVVILFMIYVYRPGLFSNMTLKNGMIVLGFFAGVIAVAWEKIEFYFITGGDPTAVFDEDLMVTVARPMLYVMGFFVLWDHLLLGSGLASYATSPSSTDINYSNLYYDYGLDNVWGLSPGYDDFISDTFYPALTQFGLVGISLFIYVWIWFSQKLRLVIRKSGIVPFIAGVSIIAMLLIDSIAAPGIINSFGEVLMAIMGLVLAPVRTISREEAKQISQRPIELETSYWRSVRTI